MADQSKLLDLGDPGFSLGDELIFSDNVLNHRNGRKVGSDGGVCTVVRVGDAKTFSGTLQCQVTFSLSGGQITTQGLRPTAHLQAKGTETKAVIGGTGRFRGVRGAFTTTFLKNAAATVTFSLDR